MLLSSWRQRRMSIYIHEHRNYWKERRRRRRSMTWRAESWVGKMLGLAQPGQPGERQVRSRGEERRTPTKYPVGFVTVRPGIRDHSAVMSLTLRNTSLFCVFTRNIAYSTAHPIPSQLTLDVRSSIQDCVLISSVLRRPRA